MEEGRVAASNNRSSLRSQQGQLSVIIVEIVEIIENAARTTEMSKLSEEHGLMILCFVEPGIS